MTANRTHVLLLFLSTLVFGALASMFIKTIPLLFAQAIYFCQQTIAYAVKFHHTVPFLVILILSAIFIIGLIVFIVQILQTKSYIEKKLIKKIKLPKKVIHIAHTLDLQNKIDVIKDDTFVSFTYGFLFPRICLSTSLIAKLTKEELQAVLIHESYHIKSYDPLRLIFGKTVSKMFFFIPILKDIHVHYAFLKELAADQVVIKNSNRQSLVSALTTFLSQPTPNIAGVAAFASVSDLEKRILSLANKRNYSSIKLSKFRLTFSFGVLLSLILLLSSSIQVSASNGGAMGSSYFVCPFSFLDLGSCNKELQSKNNIRFNTYPISSQ